MVLLTWEETMSNITVLLVDDDVEVIDLNKKFFKKRNIKCLQLIQVWML